MDMLPVYLSVPGFSEKTPAEVQAYLQQEVRIPKIDDARYITSEKIGVSHGAAVADAIYRAINSQLPSKAAQFVHPGIDTTNPQWATYVNQFSQLVPSLAPLKDAMLDYGFVVTTKWIELGGNGDVPALDVIEAVQRRVRVDARVARAGNDILGPALAAADRTYQSIAAAYAAAAESMLQE